MPATALPHIYMHCQPPGKKQTLRPQLFATTALLCGCQEMVVSSNAASYGKVALPTNVVAISLAPGWEDGGNWQTCEHSQGMRTQLVRPMHAVQKKRNKQPPGIWRVEPRALSLKNILANSLSANHGSFCEPLAGQPVPVVD
jgi:hypothetical protein